MNADNEILDNICAVLGCARHDISNVVPMNQGLTNESFCFDVAGQRYVYRRPGAGTDEIINRANEAASQKIARELGLDKTFVYEDPERGWKISHYLEGRTNLDYHDWDSVARAMQMARTLHDSGIDTGFPYDMHQATHKTLALLSPSSCAQFSNFDELLQLADELNAKALAHGGRTCLCHNDFYDPNFLVAADGDIQLIDWEYSGMSDYASDLGVFLCCCDDYTYDDALRVLRLYFGRDPSPEEEFHCIAYTAVISYYWFIWALYKGQCGDPVGEYLNIWHRYTAEYGAKARQLAKQLGI